MVSFSALFFDPEIVDRFLRDGDGHVRAALVCWAIVLSAFIVLRVPRQMLLGCLMAGAATVFIAATLAYVVPVTATASTLEPAPANLPTAMPMRGAAAIMRGSAHSN